MKSCSYNRETPISCCGDRVVIGSPGKGKGYTLSVTICSANLLHLLGQVVDDIEAEGSHGYFFQYHLFGVLARTDIFTDLKTPNFGVVRDRFKLVCAIDDLNTLFIKAPVVLTLYKIAAHSSRSSSARTQQTLATAKLIFTRLLRKKETEKQLFTSTIVEYFPLKPTYSSTLAGNAEIPGVTVELTLSEDEGPFTSIKPKDSILLDEAKGEEELLHSLSLIQLTPLDTTCDNETTRDCISEISSCHDTLLTESVSVSGSTGNSDAVSLTSEVILDPLEPTTPLKPNKDEESAKREEERLSTKEKSLLESIEAFNDERKRFYEKKQNFETKFNDRVSNEVERKFLERESVREQSVKAAILEYERLHERLRQLLKSVGNRERSLLHYMEKQVQQNKLTGEKESGKQKQTKLDASKHLPKIQPEKVKLLQKRLLEANSSLETARKSSNELKKELRSCQRNASTLIESNGALAEEIKVLQAEKKRMEQLYGSEKKNSQSLSVENERLRKQITQLCEQQSLLKQFKSKQYEESLENLVFLSVNSRKKYADDIRREELEIQNIRNKLLRK